MDKLDEKFDAVFSEIEAEYDELLEFVSAVEIMSDHKLYNHYQSRLKEIEVIALLFKEIKSIKNDILDFEKLGKSAELEILSLTESYNSKFAELKRIYARQKETKQEKVSLEISSKESEDFAFELTRLFESFFIKKGYEYSKENNGGTIELCVFGDNVYQKLSLFSGKIKRVQRGVENFATLVVIKQEDFEIDVKDEDLEIQTSKSGGAGGQHINKTESAVKIIHLPTGIFAECQDERSQTKNREKAMHSLIKKITQNSREKSEKNIKIQRNEQKNKLFASTPVVVIDYDANKFFTVSNKCGYKLKEILDGDLDLVFNNQI